MTWDEADDETVLPFLARGFVVRLTLDDGTDRDVLAHGVTQGDDGPVVAVEGFDPETGNGDGEPAAIPLERIASVHVY